MSVPYPNCTNISETFCVFTPDHLSPCHKYNVPVIPQNGAGVGESSFKSIGTHTDCASIPVVIRPSLAMPHSSFVRIESSSCDKEISSLIFTSVEYSSVTQISSLLSTTLPSPTLSLIPASPSQLTLDLVVDQKKRYIMYIIIDMYNIHNYMYNHKMTIIIICSCMLMLCVPCLSEVSLHIILYPYSLLYSLLPFPWKPLPYDGTIFGHCRQKWGHLNKQDTFVLQVLKSGHLTNEETFFCLNCVQISSLLVFLPPPPPPPPPPPHTHTHTYTHTPVLVFPSIAKP